MGTSISVVTIIGFHYKDTNSFHIPSNLSVEDGSILPLYGTLLMLPLPRIIPEHQKPHYKPHLAPRSSHFSPIPNISRNSSHLQPGHDRHPISLRRHRMQVPLR